MKYNANKIKSGEDYFNHVKRLKTDPEYKETFLKHKEKELKKYWKELKPFNKDTDVPELPKPLEKFFINKLIELGAIPKNKLEKGKWYYGDYRNSNFGKWDGKKFHIIRYSFGFDYWDDCFHFQDDDGFALFVPLREATPEEIKNEETKL